MEVNQAEAWVARDEDGHLYLFPSKPKKFKKEGMWHCYRDDIVNLGKESFPNVLWSQDHPTKVIIKIK